MDDVKWVAREPEDVRKLATRSVRILLTLLEEMRVVPANYPVPQFLYDEGGSFIREVLDGTQPVPSKVLIRHRYSDDPTAMESYPFLNEALNIFGIAIHTAQPEKLAGCCRQARERLRQPSCGCWQTQSHPAAWLLRPEPATTRRSDYGRNFSKRHPSPLAVTSSYESKSKLVR